MADDKKVKLKTPSGAAKTQQTKFAMIGLVTLGVVLFVVMNSIPDKPEKPRVDLRTEIDTSTIEEQSWAVRAQAEVRKTQQELSEAQRLNEKLMKRLETLTSKQQSSDAEMRGLLGRLEKLEKQPKIKEVPVPMSGKGNTPLAGIPVPVEEDGRPKGAVPPPRPWSDTDNDSQVGYRPNNMRVTQPNNADQPLIITSADGGPGNQLEEAEATSEYVKNPFAGFLPAGSFAKGVLLTGVDAGASEYTRSNPQPVLIRIQEDATMAGDQNYALKTCFIMGNAYGDLSSERAHIRLARLSCTDSKRGLVLETTLRGYAVDSDGTQGLRGKVVRRNGQLIAKALLSGLAQGLADAASTVSSNAAATVVGTGLTGGLTQQSTDIDSGKLAETAGFQGIGNATQILADMYLNEAKSIFPVIFVPAGRVVSVVISEGTGLEWSEHRALYQKKIKPEK